MVLARRDKYLLLFFVSLHGLVWFTKPRQLVCVVGCGTQTVIGHDHCIASQKMSNPCKCVDNSYDLRWQYKWVDIPKHIAANIYKWSDRRRTRRLGQHHASSSPRPGKTILMCLHGASKQDSSGGNSHSSKPSWPVSDNSQHPLQNRHNDISALSLFLGMLMSSGGEGAGGAHERPLTRGKFSKTGPKQGLLVHSEQIVMGGGRHWISRCRNQWAQL